jgi:AmmeMemoRadiSam system protein A
MSERLTEEEKRFCLELARRAVEGFLRTGVPPEVKVEPGKLREKRGAFVTLKVDGELRGCIGYPLPYKPLYQTIMETAVAAAAEDFRFEPLRPEELGRLRIEVSVLDLPETVADPGQVEVGRHGIIISRGHQQGLLLPQVPLEYGWDRETFLRHGCLKAGLEPDAWKKGARIEVFAAQVFGEEA